MTKYVPPTAEELSRVAEYWRRVKAMTCEHPTFTTGMGDGLTCGGDCGRPLRVLSDVQIEEIKRPKDMPDNVRDDLIKQLGRGGVVFTTDNQRYEARLHAHDDFGHECVCLDVDNIALMLRATEGRYV